MNGSAQAINIIGIGQHNEPRTAVQLAVAKSMASILDSQKLDLGAVCLTSHQSCLEVARAIVPGAVEIHVLGSRDFEIALPSYPVVVEDPTFKPVKMSSSILEQVGTIRREILANKRNGTIFVPLGVAYYLVRKMWNEGRKEGQRLLPHWWPMAAGDMAVLRFHEDGTIFSNKLIKGPA